jgi:hypothetical protein
VSTKLSSNHWNCLTTYLRDARTRRKIHHRLHKIRKVKLYHNTPCKRWGERSCNSCLFLTSALDGGERSASCYGRALPPRKYPGTNWAGGWVGLRSGLDTEDRGKVLFLCQGSKPGRPVCSQSLYWLKYPSLEIPIGCCKSFWTAKIYTVTCKCCIVGCAYSDPSQRNKVKQLSPDLAHLTFTRINSKIKS